jgi:hypothetical protein
MFRDKYGLLSTNGNSEENSFLWTVELFVVLKKKGECTSALEHTINQSIKKMDLGKGLYKQAPHLSPDSNNKDTYMSHDQLTALCVFFKLTGQENKIKEINKAFKFGISYNNVDSKFRPFHPRDLIFYKILSGSILAWLFLPLLLLITIETFFREYKVRNNNKIIKTDGEILYYIKREASSCFKLVNSYCEKRVKERFGTWDKLFAVYFKDSEFPINKIENK